MESLPPELLLHIVRFLTDLNDKCQLSICCRRFQTLLCSHPWCWSPLDFSPYCNRLTNATLLSFLKSCSIPCIQPTEVCPPSGSNPATSVRELDISGCWSLTAGAIHLLACSLPHLHTLHLNKYSSSKKGRWPLEHREHLYHVQPSHNLSSLAMDLAKEPSMGLGLSETTVQQVLMRCAEVETLSLQYQQLGRTACNAIIRLQHLCHLDVSSCATDQPVLQILLRTVGPRLRTLKMLNLDLTNLTLISIKQHARLLSCLHLSCADPARLASIANVVGSLPLLEDFRMTRLRTGSVDMVVQRLNPACLKRLDLSPKMDLHPLHNPRTFSQQLIFRGQQQQQPQSQSQSQQQQVAANGNSRGRLRGAPAIASSKSPQPPPQQPRTMAACFTRTEHELDLTDQSLLLLAGQFSALVELRVCYPRFTDPESMTALLVATAARLEVLELRLEMQKHASYSINSHSSANGGGGAARLTPAATATAGAQAKEATALTQVDMLQGLRQVQMPRLRELAVYHTWMSTATAHAIGRNLRHLTHMTIYNCGRLADYEPDLVRFWLTSHPRLQVLRIGKLGNVRCDLLEDIAVPKQQQQPPVPQANTMVPVAAKLVPDKMKAKDTDGDIVFHRRVSPGEEIFVYSCP